MWGQIRGKRFDSVPFPLGLDYEALLLDNTSNGIIIMGCRRKSLNSYEWINLGEIESIQGKRIIVFGAGKGTEELFLYLKEFNSNTEIVAIVDNDSTFWGKTLAGYEIIHPERLMHTRFDKIVVTSVSGRETIAEQLQKMGFCYPRDYILVGRYPLGYINNFNVLLKELNGTFDFQGSNCLHVGPGGFLGLEVMVYCYGANTVHSIDKFGFRANFPDVTNQRKEYMEIKRVLDTRNRDMEHNDEVLGRFKKVFIKNKDRIQIDKNKIEYHFPVDVCNLDFNDKTFDIVLSFAVLEHVTNPEAAVSEMARVLKRGGFSFHTIVTEDHRCFSEVSSYTPFSFRSYSEKEWEELTCNKFYQNRLLPFEWKKLFEENYLQMQKYFVHKKIEIELETAEGFHSGFRKFSLEQLGEFNCTIVAKKN